MSTTEIVRRAWDAAAPPEPDVETLARLYAPDHVLITNRGTGDQRRYRGFEGFRPAAVVRLRDGRIASTEYHLSADEALSAAAAKPD